MFQAKQNLRTYKNVNQGNYRKGFHLYYQFCLGMDQKNENSDSNAEKVVKSCDEKIGVDLIEDNSFEGVPNRGLRSYQSRESDGQNWAELSEMQKLQYRKEISQGLGKVEENKHIGMKDKYKGEGKKFADEVIISETVTINEGSIQSGKSSNEQKEQQMMKAMKNKEQSWLNIMLVGGAGTGKTTFKECFLRHYKHKNNDEVIKQHTTQLELQKAIPIFDEPNLNVTIVDTPGYNLITFPECQQLVTREIQRRYENFNYNKIHKLTESSIYRNQKVEDERIHCVLFFLKGPRIQEYDWKFLSELQKMVSVIPIIAKGDIYTIEEIKEFKKKIREKVISSQVKWFDIEEYIRQRHERQLNSLLKGPYGLAPPFVISTSTVQIQCKSKLKVGRQYKWGICFTEDSQHTDFLLLNRMLLRFLRQPLIRYADLKAEDCMRTFKTKERKKLAQKVLTVGLGTVALSVLFYKFNKDIIPILKK